MDKRLLNEIEHGKKISSDAESIWNWSSPAGIKRADRRAELIVSEGKIVYTDNVLEIGCGTGLFTRKVFKHTGARITAIDISEDLIIHAKAKSSDSNYLLGNAMELDFQNEYFNVVYGSSVLHHLNMEKALIEIYRVLAKDGRMIFAEPNMLNPQIFIQKNIPFIKKWLGDSPDETAIVRWSFTKMMKKVGFKNIKIFPHDFLHPITPEPLINTIKIIGEWFEKIPIIKEIAGSVLIYGEK